MLSSPLALSATWSEVTPTTYTWADAYRYCSGMAQNTGKDWRLPTVNELSKRYTLDKYRPPWNPNGSLIDWVWSSSTRNGASHFLVNVNNGSKSWASHPAYVSCVRESNTDPYAWQDTALSAMDLKDWTAALRSLQPEVSAHNPVAYFLISKLYFDGNGVEKSESKAFNYLLEAARLGHGLSALSVGLLYEAGRGTPQNRNAALYWFDRAAALGDPDGAPQAARLRAAR